MDPFLAQNTKNISKEHKVTLEILKKNGPGRKSSKHHNDEAAQKDIAVGIQHPIESFILEKNNNEASQNELGGKSGPQFLK